MRPRHLVFATGVEVEVDTQACRGRGIPILRRASGGAAIVGGPGCLMAKPFQVDVVSPEATV